MSEQSLQSQITAIQQTMRRHTHDGFETQPIALQTTTSPGTVTNVSVITSNGISGSVANSTTTPAITLTLGAITPTTIVASGNISGANLTGTNTGDQTLNGLLPSQTGQSGNYLQTNGSNSLWSALPAGLTSKFGGTGADGALSVSSGTTTIALGGVAVVIKNYSSISITGTGNIAFSGANATGTKVIFLCSGNSTITTSSTHSIDLRGLGGVGGNGNNGNTQGTNVIATPGTENIDDGIVTISANKFGFGSTGPTGGGNGIFGGGGASNYTAGTAGGGASGNNGKAGTAVTGFPLYFVGAQPYLGIRGFCIAGAGGGGGNNSFGIGGNSNTQASNGTGGSLGSPNGGSGNANSGSATYNFGGSGGGGAGAGGFYMEVAGAFNFTTGTIDCSGGVGGGGGNGGSGGSGSYGGSGGGGGSGGTCIIYYNTLTANSGTVSIAGGIGGTAGTGLGGGANGQNGGNAGNGFSYIGINQWFT